MKITRELFEQQRGPRFGTANPERMQLAFWEWMIRGDDVPPPAGSGLSSVGLMMREGKLKSSYGPHRARDLFNVQLNREEGPIWTFDRMGRTCNELPDGRVVCIGGEHEDFYDPDFYIYNDVVVFNGDEIEIYGYPKEVLPPTDFHTATIRDGKVIIIGGLGYKNERISGFTPVYALDLANFHITQIETKGDMPGWIHKHTAEIQADGGILIRGGQLVREATGGQRFLQNADDFSLNLELGVWHRATDRKWHQYKVRREDRRAIPLKPYEKAKSLLPRTISYTVVLCEWRNAHIVVEGVNVLLDVGILDIDIVIQGQLPNELMTLLCEEVLMNAQAFLQCKCSLERL